MKNKIKRIKYIKINRKNKKKIENKLDKISHRKNYEKNIKNRRNKIK